MAEEIKIKCQVEPATNLCCLNLDCANCIPGQWVCNLKNATIGLNHTCVAYVKIKSVKKPKGE